MWMRPALSVIPVKKHFVLSGVCLFERQSFWLSNEMADLVVYSIFRKYEHGDDQFYSILAHRLDRVGGIQHGLFERI